MKINADLTQRAVVDSAALDWVPSPAPGVERRMLDRDGNEVARATTLVRYAANSTFPSHAHGGGEEFLVLQGTFADEAGSYPAGTYVRNPVGSAHAPTVADGCVILVKLHQMDPDDQQTVVVDTTSAAWQETATQGHARMPLHRFSSEDVALERLAPGTTLPEETVSGGKEVFVLKGSFEDGEGVYGAGAWLRLPSGSAHMMASPEGCELWVKRGHLG